MEKGKASFSKYDVLVEPPVPGVSVDYSLTKHNNHVGNLRFRVFLNMKQQSYMGARQRNDSDECNRIVNELIDTVCHQVVPRGRFLVSKSVIVGDGEPELLWENLDDTALKSLLHKVLEPCESTPTSLIGANPLEGSSFVSPDQVTSRHLLEGQLPPHLEVPLVSLPPLGSSDADDGQKRRRRSSLLRRSNSESMVEMVLDNRKKLNHNANDPRGGIQEEPASWKSASPAGHLNRMDVVLTPSCDALDPSCITVGNNRLHILSAVRSGQFRIGSIEEQEKILDEMVETVYTFWKGRFLVETPGRVYDELSKGEAREAMRIILNGGSAPNPNKNTASRSLWQSDLADEIKSFETLNVAASSQPATRSLKGQELQHIASPLQNFAVTLPSALIEDAHKNQNRALMDLKKQKTRNQNASRLMEKLGVAKKKTASAPSSDAGEELPLFPIGGMVHPSMLNTNSPGANNKWFSPQTSRESTVFGKVDASVMEKLVAELDDAEDYYDDIDEPLPLSKTNSFNNPFDGD